MKLIKRAVIGLLVIQLVFLAYPVRNEAAQPTKLVQITAEIVEVDNTKMNEVGIKWEEIFAGTELSYHGETGTYRHQGSTAQTNVPVYRWDKLGKIRRTGAVRASLKLLEDKGAAHTMANPKLITESGSEATFLAGGEIPVPVQTEDGIGIEWKEYGVSLDIKPTALAKKKIRANVKASVTSLDWTNAVTTAQTITPALKTRTVSSRMTVEDGDTIVIAGLVQTQKEKSISGIPGLCKIPGVGLLFGRTKWVNNKTTVVIFVTLSLTEAGAEVVPQ